MEQTTTGAFRVLPGREDGELLLVDPDTADPTYVPREGPAADLEPGNLVRATLAWADGAARVTDVTVRSATRYRFYRTEEPIFEAARDCWEEALAAGEAMNARVTRGTDGAVNGVVYTFAAQPGRRDLFDEFRDGTTPLEPLVDRLRGDDAPGVGSTAGPEPASGVAGDADDAGDEDGSGDADADSDRSPPFALFVVDPADEPFVVVAIALDPEGLLARTIRETYGDASLTDFGGMDDAPGAPGDDVGIDPTDYEDRFDFGG